MKPLDLPISSRPDFTSLPSDPSIAWTDAQERALFGDHADAALRRAVQRIAEARCIETKSADILSVAAPITGVPDATLADAHQSNRNSSFIA